MKRLILILISCLFLPGCQMKSASLKPAALEGTDQGEVFLYTRPFQQEADRLRFNIEGIYAVRDDGTSFPLSAALNEIKSRDMKRQRLIASGRLPEGSYTGFSFKIRDAFLETEEGEAALLVTDGPAITDFPFEIVKEKSYALSLEFNYIKSIWKGVGFRPSFSIAFPERPVVNLSGYTANYSSNNITVFDKRAMEVTGVITTGRGPSGIALDERFKRAYVTLSDDDSVDVIDMTAGERINTIRLNTGDRPGNPALTPDGKTLLTVNSQSDTVSVIDPLAFFEMKRINVGSGPNSIEIDNEGRRAYVFNTLSSTISVIDLASASVAATISTEPGPLRGQFNRDGNRLYVIHEWSSYVSVIDPSSLSTLDRVRAGIGVNTLKLDTRSDLFYIGKKNDPVVEVYDPLSSFPVDYINGEGNASYITIDNEGNNLYLVVPETKTLIIVNIISKRIISKIDVGESPSWVTMMGER